MKKTVAKKAREGQTRSRRSPMPKLGTIACREYFLAYSQINSFFDFVLHTVSHIDQAAEVAHKALVDTEHDPDKSRNWKNRG